MFFEYGDDSVAQLGGVHLACEQASNLLTKVLERGRLMAYLEQSTRYVRYDSRLATGHYRYYRDPDILASPLGARFIGDMDRMFETYGELLPSITAWLARRYPRQGDEPELPHRQAIRAKGLDALRGLLPAGSLSNVGIYGSAQAYERLVMRMRADPLPEARRYGELVLVELRKVIPSFLSRVDRPDRGGAWVDYLRSTTEATEAIVARLWPDQQPGGVARGAGSSPPAITDGQAKVHLVEWDPEGELKVLAAMCYPYSSASDEELIRRVGTLPSPDQVALAAAYIGERHNRRHLPGRAFERTSYRFDIECDYGAFRDLQRHRLLTVDWQALSPHLGADLPEVVEEAGAGPAYRESMERSAELYEALRPSWPIQASYAVALGFRVRFSLQLNAREAMHLIELRSSRQGHPAYRWVAQQMHRLIAERAGHRVLAQAMVFVDHDVHDLERLAAAQDVDRRRSPAARALPGL